MKLKHVAKMMQICEFDLFRQAYAASHGSAFNDEFVAQTFCDYADHGVVPVWVSMYAKSVVENCKVAEPIRAIA